jgi:hypothetical protein
MTKDEMKVNVTYIICPEKTCRLFWDTITEGALSCDGYCPFKSKLQLAIICHNCLEIITLPGNHSMWARIDHKCPNGDLAGNFRMSGKYHLLYKLPEG